MADEIAPISAPETAPAPVEAAPAPVAASESPAIEAAPVAAPVAADTAAPTVEVQTPAPDAVTAEPGVEAAPDAPAEIVAPTEPAVPTYEAFKVPEGFALPEERLTEFTGVLGKYGLTQEAGQELLDLHAATLTQAQSAMDQRQRDVFQDTRRAWREDFYKTAGNRSDTMANDAKWAITHLVTDKAARAEINGVLDATGAGDNKAIIGLLAKVARALHERNAPPQGIPPKGRELTPAERRYGARPAG